MSARLERLAEDILGKLPSNHPDKHYLVSVADGLHLFNVEHEASLTPHQLVHREAHEWHDFFGERTTVTTPPKELIEARQRLREVGMNDFAAVYMPKLSLTKRSTFPGYKLKLPESFWEIHASNKSASFNETQDAWMLVDLTKRPHYSMGTQGYYQDELHDVIEKLRVEDRVKTIQRGDYMIPQGSRFGVSKEELTRVIYPEIAHLVRVAPEQVRSLTCLENNLLGNRTFSEFGLDSTGEWFHSVGVGGSGFFGGMSEISEKPKMYRSKRIGFRPAIVFS